MSLDTDSESPPRSINKLPKSSNSGGQLQVIFGPMFSGKTTELLRRMRRYQIRNDRCLLLKTKDTRYQNDQYRVVTHDQNNYLAGLATNSLFSNLIQSEIQQADVIGIDQGQFFPQIIEFCESMANSGKIVIVACLDSDFRREPFGNICSLVAKAETVTKLSSICQYCKGDAAFSARITNETDIKVIGGQDKYKPVCRSCYSLINNPV